MARIPVFYSFHFDNDCMRTQMVRNIGALEGDEPVSINDWETIKRGGVKAIEKWIDDNMSHRRCVIVLIGTETAARPWVRYEIIKAWNEKRGLFGIHIHNLNCPRNGTCSKGTNPFAVINMQGGGTMANYVTTYDPGTSVWDDTPYKTIASNIEGWVNTAIAQGKTR